MAIVDLYVSFDNEKVGEIQGNGLSIKWRRGILPYFPETLLEFFKSIGQGFLPRHFLPRALTAAAAIVSTARLNAATITVGNLFELDSIAACIIGGKSTLGGFGTVHGALVGALIMASLDNGMSLMNLDIMYQYVL